MAAVTLRGIRKTLGPNLILRGIDLALTKGEFAVLVGPSGCGKSTLLRTVAGLEEPDAGTILLGDRDVTRAPPRDRDIAMVFQSYALYPHLTVRDNLAFGLKLRKASTPKEIAARVDEVARMLAIEPLLDRFPRDLSGGQRQRVAMGRAIVRRPQLFLFDEPLSNLDAALRAEVRVEIKRLHATPRRHHALRDPRPGRGHDPRRPPRGASRRIRRAGGPAARGLPAPRARASSPPSSARPR